MATSNKFTKSILERLEQEKNILGEKEAVKADGNNKIPLTETVTKEKKVEKQSSFSNLDDIISPLKERQAKNKTFYLDISVIKALNDIAKQKKMTDSKLCNDILKAVLGIE